MLDRFGREINYLRISVTDRCNLRCYYCIPKGEVEFFPEERLISNGEIVRIARIAAELGIVKIRLTGGEPLLRKNIVELVGELARIDGINDLSMSTNGTLLKKFARPLADAGLMRVNVSLDTTDAKRYAEITGFDRLHDVIEGLDAAEKAGLLPIKLNCVVKKSSSEADAQMVAKFAKERGFEVRFIRQMNLAAGKFWIVEGGTGGDCAICNRLRLTADGYIKPCLFSDIAFSVKELGAKNAILKAIAEKPKTGTKSLNCSFFNIGG